MCYNPFGYGSFHGGHVRNILRVIAIATLVSFTLSSCATNGHSKEEIGGVTGGILGGILGYNLFGKGNGRLVGAAIGAIALYLVGKSLGKYMDEADHSRLVEANQRGLSGPANTPYVERWSRGNRDITTVITPSDSHQANGGSCRHYTQETFVTIGGRTEKATQEGIACWNAQTRTWDLYRK